MDTELLTAFESAKTQLKASRKAFNDAVKEYQRLCCIVNDGQLTGDTAFDVQVCHGEDVSTSDSLGVYTVLNDEYLQATRNHLHEMRALMGKNVPILLDLEMKPRGSYSRAEQSVIVGLLSGDDIVWDPRKRRFTLPIDPDTAMCTEVNERCLVTDGKNELTLGDVLKVAEKMFFEKLARSCYSSWREAYDYPYTLKVTIGKAETQAALREFKRVRGKTALRYMPFEM